MTETQKNHTSISRRAALAGSALALAPLPLARRATAQSQVTLVWMTSQRAPRQVAAYNHQIATFVAENPGVRIVIEGTSDATYAPRLAAAFASKQVPDLITHLPSFAVANYWVNGLLAPLNDVIDTVGASDFYERANRIFEITEGQFAATGIGNTAADMLWVRRDLMANAGITTIPRTWDELRTACQRMQGRGIYGAPLPYGKNPMTTAIFLGFLHRAGGQVFTPDLQVALNSREAVNALEFYRSMRELSPPGATNYTWGDSLNAFVTGATATGIYSGRVIQNVATQNPRLADHITCTTYPTISADVPSWTYNNFPSVFIPKDGRNVELAKKFASHLFRRDGYVMQVLAAPGHIVPVLKSVASDPTYLADPLINKYKAEVDLMADAAAKGHNVGYESPQHKVNVKGGEVTNSDIIAEVVQRVCLNREDARTVLGDASRRIEAIMRS